MRFLLILFCLLLIADASAQTKAVGDSTSDCFTRFFNRTSPVQDTAILQLQMPGKKALTWTAFKKEIFADNQLLAGRLDLDNDGKKEMVVWSFTGGAHCCDEFYFFSETKPAHYLLTGKLKAGNTYVDDSNIFTYELHEQFGYFFTCYACGLETDTAVHTGLQPATELRLRYKNGGLQIMPPKPGLKETINRNLTIIKKMGWDGGVPDGKFDNGRRKELALNLAAFYFSFGKNMAETKNRFNATYTFRDAATVWKAFLQTIKTIEETNTF